MLSTRDSLFTNRLWWKSKSLPRTRPVFEISGQNLPCLWPSSRKPFSINTPVWYIFYLILRLYGISDNSQWRVSMTSLSMTGFFDEFYNVFAMILNLLWSNLLEMGLPGTSVSSIIRGIISTILRVAMSVVGTWDSIFSFFCILDWYILDCKLRNPGIRIGISIQIGYLCFSVFYLFLGVLSHLICDLSLIFKFLEIKRVFFVTHPQQVWKFKKCFSILVRKIQFIFFSSCK